jgi:preprotein translocase subunit YajC
MAPAVSLTHRNDLRMSAIGFAPSLLALQMPSFGSSGQGLIFQVVSIFVIFYFFLIRPQQQQKKKHEEALRGLKRGDQVVTFGGIIGEVVHVKETTTGTGAMDDQITIRSAESRLIVERGRIARIVGPTPAATKE